MPSKSSGTANVNNRYASSVYSCKYKERKEEPYMYYTDSLRHKKLFWHFASGTVNSPDTNVLNFFKSLKVRSCKMIDNLAVFRWRTNDIRVETGADKLGKTRRVYTYGWKHVHHCKTFIFDVAWHRVSSKTASLSDNTLHDFFNQMHKLFWEKGYVYSDVRIIQKRKLIV